MKVPFSYLERQFADIDDYLDDIREVVRRTDFTLGAEVERFERAFADYIGVEHAVGVGSGTEALILPMKCAGIGPGDEIITAANTFIATAGAIVSLGAKPVFVDSEDGYVIDTARIEAAITPRTQAIVPVHYTGNMADMDAVMEIAARHGLMVFEDACQAIGGRIGEEPAGSWGRIAAYSVHPLKNVNVWGDGGLILTNDADFAEELRLYRNHGLTDRDHVAIFGVNSRLDTVQAAIGLRLVKDAPWITERRLEIAARYDAAFADLAPALRVPERRPGVRHVFHLYILRAERRDTLVKHLHAKDIEAKIHYPVPIHLQKASEVAGLGYKRGDFPITEADSDCVVTLPAHQHLSDAEVGYVIETVRGFYDA